MSAILVVSFQLTLNTHKRFVLGRNPRNVVATGRPSVIPLWSHVTIHTKGKTLYISECRKRQEHASLSTHVRNHYGETLIRNVKTLQHKHSHYWAKDCEIFWIQWESLNVLSIWGDMRICSGEKVLSNVISTRKSSLFPILRKLRTHCKEPCEYKDWRNAFNEIFYIRKNMKFSLDAKPVSVLILEDLPMIPVCWLVRTHIRGRP